MDNQDTIYVIYFDGKIFNQKNNKKCGYVEGNHAKLVVDSEMRRIAHEMYNETNPKQCWYNLGEKNKQEWLIKARQRFEIKEFIEKNK